jgi:hypothetical protein
MKLSELQSIFAVNAALLILEINKRGFTCRFGEAWRTPEMAAMYAKEGTGIKHSLHCDRMAVDLLISKDGVWLTDTESYRFAGVYWCSLNTLNRWGGDWDGDGVPDPGENDGNHFECRREPVCVKL